MCDQRLRDVPLSSATHSLSPAPSTRSISAKVHRVYASRSGHSDSAFRSLRWCPSQILPRKWGGHAWSLKGLAQSHVTACLGLPFFLPLLYSFNKHQKTYILELGELFILVFRSLIQQMFTYHANVSNTINS